MADKTVTADIVVNDKASKPLDKVGDAAERNARRTRNAFKRADTDTGGVFKRMGVGAVAVGTMLGSLGASAVTGLVSLGAQAVTTGVKTAAFLEQAQIGFTKMMGSSEDARAALSELTSFAASTPFEMKGLVESTRILMGVGVGFKDSKKILEDFGDASAALALPQENFSRIMIAVGQSISSGRIQLGDMNQLMNNGLPIWTLLSKAMHKPVPELRDMISKGKLMTSDVLPKLQAQMHADYGGSMQKQGETLNGLWSTFKDTLALGMADALQGILPLLRDAMPGAIAVLKKGLEGLGGVLETVGGFIKGVAEIVRSDWNAEITSSMTPVQKLQTAIAWLVETVQAFFSGLSGGAAGMVGFHGRLQTVAFAGMKVRDAAIAMWKYLKELFAIVKGSFNAVWGTLVPLLDKVSGGLKGTGTSGKDLKVVLAAVGAVVKVAAGLIGGILAVNLAAAIVTFKVLSTVIKTLVIPVIKAIAIVFLDVVGDIIAGAAKAFGWVPGVGPKLRRASAQFDAFRERANAAMNGITRTLNVSVWARVHIIGANGRTIRADLARKTMSNAQGGYVPPGALSVVGEEGPELVRFHSGATVMNHQRTRSLASNLGGGGTTLVFNFPNAVIGNEQHVARTVTDAIRRSAARGARFTL